MLCVREFFEIKKTKPQAQTASRLSLVPLTGIEPVRYFYRGILSPLRLPVPPQRQVEGIEFAEISIPCFCRNCKSKFNFYEFSDSEKAYFREYSLVSSFRTVSLQCRDKSWVRGYRSTQISLSLSFWDSSKISSSPR